MEEDKVYIKISLEEYKELLIIKGKYEELKKLHEPITIDWSGFKEDGNTAPKFEECSSPLDNQPKYCLSKED